MSNEFNVTNNLLIGSFAYGGYAKAVHELKSHMQNSVLTKQEWEITKRAIVEKLFAKGEPLELVREGANTPLDENTDEEAYRWLDLFVRNVERPDDSVQEY